MKKIGLLKKKVAKLFTNCRNSKKDIYDNPFVIL